jgi:hypothetical protein
LALFYDVEARSIRRSRKINFPRFSPGFISPAEREKGLAKSIPYVDEESKPIKARRYSQNEFNEILPI